MSNTKVTKNSKRSLAASWNNADCYKQSKDIRAKNIIALIASKLLDFMFSVLTTRTLSATTQSIILILFVMAIVSLIYCIQFLIVYAVILVL